MELNSYNNPADWKIGLIKLVFLPITWGFSKLIGSNENNSELKDVTYVNVTILKVFNNITIIIFILFIYYNIY